MREIGRRWAAIAAVLITLVVGCGGPSTSTQSSAAAPDQQPRAKKILTIAMTRETDVLRGYPDQGGTRRGAGIELDIGHNQLVVKNDEGDFVAQLAAEQISVERGTWRVNQDGSMDTTWKLRPNVLWHDGAPFTSADLLFTFEVSKDPALPNRYSRALEAMESAAAPDPQTFIVHWSSIYVPANEAPALGPLPRHLTEATFVADKERFLHTPPFTSDFIGLGPYRLVKWEPGSHTEFAPFDRYYMGRPRFDTLFVRYVPDPNAMAATILAGAVDMLLPPSVNVEAAMEIKRRWEGTDNVVRADLTEDVRILRVQQQPAFARPRSGFPNVLVRQALYHALDRPALADVMTFGQAPAVDSWFPPYHPFRAEVESSIPRYPYDVSRAQQLLAQAGWTRGSDGVLMNQASGERFESEIWASSQIGSEKEVTLIGDQWKAVGAATSVYVIPSARSRDREHIAQFPSAITGEPNWAEVYQQYLHSRELATAANNWSGRNSSGYTNPRYDALVDRAVLAINPRERLPIEREALQVGMGEVGTMPLYWGIQPLVMLGGIKGPARALTAGWNLWDWDRE